MHVRWGRWPREAWSGPAADKRQQVEDGFQYMQTNRFSSLQSRQTLFPTKADRPSSLQRQTDPLPSKADRPSSLQRQTDPLLSKGRQTLFSPMQIDRSSSLQSRLTDRRTLSLQIIVYISGLVGIPCCINQYLINLI